MNKPLAAENILGAARAEVDSSMLRQAFVETADYLALTQTQDFNFVVGRRGTGKSVLFQKVQEHFTGKGVIVLADKPEEHDVMLMRHLLRETKSDYSLGRAIYRLAWRISILLAVTYHISKHYKINKIDSGPEIVAFAGKYQDLMAMKVVRRCRVILQRMVSHNAVDHSLPAHIASSYDVESLQASVRTALAELSMRTLVLIDGLDEGWEPSAGATAILGGLASAISAFAESSTSIHGTIFVRDNIFRALAHFDSDFSRNIEGSTLRLHWDEPSLFTLVVSRLRVFLHLEAIEKDAKIWNRFAHRDLRDREGFRRCLRYTLYRPRDILVLLNRAYVIAARQKRQEIIDEDIEATATSISRDRLDDLLKEYQTVLPGLRYFVQVFAGRTPLAKVGEIVDLLDGAIDATEYKHEGEGDFALLGDGRQIFLALFAVGFIGLKNNQKGEYIFSYDGSLKVADDITADQQSVIHPCYWRAMGFSSEVLPEEIAIAVNDEYGYHTPTEEAGEVRTTRLGQVIEELPRLPLGQEGSSDFEKWVLRAVTILFSSKLANFQLKPNPVGVQRRDVVATNIAEKGFWRRVFEDFKSRQVVFEIKNYAELSEADFRQAISYTGREYGNFVVIITRADREALSEKDRDWVREMYTLHGKLIFLTPALVLKKCLAKMRTSKPFDFTEDSFSKRMDTFQRSYLSLSTTRRFRKRKR